MKSPLHVLVTQLVLLLCGLLTLLPGLTRAEEVRVAVASNFAEPLRAIGEAFTQETGHTLKISSGSTGKLYAQIRQGAPYDVFLAADAERPRLLEEQGQVVPGNRFTYALGQIVLWSRDPELIQPNPESPNDSEPLPRIGEFRHLAIANPRLAPYGAAAKEVLVALQMWEEVEGNLVQGENIAQTYHFIATGNAELGFVAASQLQRPEQEGQPDDGHPELKGSSWHPPASLYTPIQQDAVLLRATPAAEALLEFLKGEQARALLQAYGYRSADE